MQGPIFLGRACRIDKTINRYFFLESLGKGVRLRGRYRKTRNVFKEMDGLLYTAEV